MVQDFVFHTIIRGKSIALGVSEIGNILGIPAEGWAHYVCQEWPPLDNLPSALEITRKFSGNLTLPQRKCV